MNKRELVEQVCEDLGTTKAAAEEIVDRVLAVIQEGVQRDGEVVLTGFGSWHRRERAPRTGRHPQTGEAIEIPAAKSVAFRPARAWKENLGKEKEMEAGA